LGGVLLWTSAGPQTHTLPRMPAKTTALPHLGTSTYCARLEGVLRHCLMAHTYILEMCQRAAHTSTTCTQHTHDIPAPLPADCLAHTWVADILLWLGECLYVDVKEQRLGCSWVIALHLVLVSNTTQEPVRHKGTRRQGGLTHSVVACHGAVAGVCALRLTVEDPWGTPTVLGHQDISPQQHHPGA
jgi:hypothetical protein